MRRVNLFVIVLIASLVSLTGLIVAGMYVFAAAQQSPWSWMTGTWGEMMDGGMMGGNGGTVANPALPYFAVAFVVLVAVAIVGVAGMAYYLALPEIRAGASPVICENFPQGGVVAGGSRVELKQDAACTPLESVVKTLSEDERKVVDVLLAHDGSYLQKYIRGEAGLSRLQTHRVVARLAERGIVTFEKSGNTNLVLLADWLKK